MSFYSIIGWFYVVAFILVGLLNVDIGNRAMPVIVAGVFFVAHEVSCLRKNLAKKKRLR